MKKLCLAIALLLALSLCLCACGEAEQTPTGNQDTTPDVNDESTGPVITGPSGTDPITPDYESYAYTVQVIDADGNPMEGIFVQICAGETCVPVMTDANGIAAFPNTISGDGELVAKIITSTIPEGYSCVDSISEIPLQDGETNVGFVLYKDTE